MAQLEHIEVIEKRLWNAADTLRANSNYASNEYSQNDAYFITLCTHTTEIARWVKLPMEQCV